MLESLTGSKMLSVVRLPQTLLTATGPNGRAGTSAHTPTQAVVSNRAVIIACVVGDLVTIQRRRTAAPAVKDPLW